MYKNLTIFDLSENPTKEYIYESNHLVEARYKLSVMEQKILHFLFSLIKKNDKEFKSFKFKAKDLVKELNLNTNNYKVIRKSINDLKSRSLSIYKKETNSLLEMNWLTSAEYYFNSWIIELEISDKLRPYLLDLEREFTKYPYKIVQSFDSQYSPRFYKLLKQYHRIWSRVFELEELKSKLMIDSWYDKYGHFKSKVLSQVEKELKEKADVFFNLNEVEELKRWKKVVGLKINILSQKGIEVNDKSDLEELWFSEEKILIFNTLKKLLILEMKDKELITVLSDNTTDKLLLVINILEKYINKWNVQHRKEYFLKLLKTDDLSDTAIDFKIKAKKAREKQQIENSNEEKRTKATNEIKDLIDDWILKNNQEFTNISERIYKEELSKSLWKKKFKDSTIKSIADANARSYVKNSILWVK